MRLFIVLAVASLAAACSSSPPAGTGSPGTAPASVAPVYVFNFYAAEHGKPDQHPADLVVSEFTSLKGITWRTWGPDTAVGAGKLSGSWCLPACLDRPYDATVTLSSVKTAQGQAYFSKYEIDADVAAAEQGSADLNGTLQTP
ncbi:hypothetical protein [Acrocarpospora catenulata]|uniref:hypothetical protein n=1 Tax=Acrocarpospora catenulata TaxID=2836182 RepID=UPI001BD9BFF3|nr:hypothetical protein [Acrocarpospora catenulata]